MRALKGNSCHIQCLLISSGKRSRILRWNLSGPLERGTEEVTDRVVVEGMDSGRLEDDWCIVEVKWTGGVAAAESTIEADVGGNADWRWGGTDVIEEVANLADSCWKTDEVGDKSSRHLQNTCS